MGLAASQARLFGITARKADCEFKAMELAQQKLEITDQLASIANDYSNAMNTTSLLWCDAYGDSYGLTYGILMNPSASNNYNPYFVTTSTGAVVLNSTYAAAAQAAGIPQSGTACPSQSMRDKFIAALVPAGVLTQDTANGINVTDYVAKVSDADSSKIIIETDPNLITNNAVSVEWHEDAGLGRIPADNKAAYFIETLVDLKDDSDLGGKKVSLPSNSYSANGGLNYNKSGNGATLIKNGFITSEGQGLTLSDLLSNEYVYMTHANVDTVSNSIQGLLKSVAQILGYGEIGKGINTDASSDYALTYAYNMTKNTFLSSSNYVKSAKCSHPTSGVTGANQSAAENNPTYVDALANNKICHDDNGYSAINISNMVAAFLSYYDNALMGTSSPYIVSGKVQDSLFVTLNPSYQYIVAAKENEVMSQTERLGDFYDQLVNNICAKGWREDDNVDDYEHLANSLKNGRYQLSTLHTDGQYYQIRYNEATYMENTQKSYPCIEEFKDEDAVARAEVDYTKKKAELTYKEDSIDLKTKSLDSEIAQLNQEYETVKNLVTKNIEKTFTMYSN